MSQSKQYYPFLDALRGISILWVMLHHARWFLNLYRFDFGYFDPLIQLIGLRGFLGVDLFFVTSGFLITGLLIDEYNAGRINVGRFYARRFFKIVPHYLLVVASGLGILFLFYPAEPISAQSIFGYLFFYQNYRPLHLTTLAHTWSIAIEEHFYLLYPLILLALITAFKKAHNKVIPAVLVFLTLLVLGNMSRYYFFFGDPGDNPMTYQFTHVRFDALMFGCLIRFCQPGLISRGYQSLLGTMCLAVSVVLFVFMLEFYQRTVWYFPTLAYVSCGLLIVAALNQSRPLALLAQDRLLVKIGKCSYGIYLWHYLVITLFSVIVQPSECTLLIVLLYAMLSIALGMLMTYTWERYFLTLRSRLVP